MRSLQQSAATALVTPCAKPATVGLKRVVFVNRYFYPDQSATSQVLTDLVKGLASSGFAVSVVCCRQLYDDAQAQLPAKEILFGATVHRVATTRRGRHGLLGRSLDYATFFGSCITLLLIIVRRGDVLVIKTDPPLMSLLALPIAAIKRAVGVTWQQDVFPEIASSLGANPLPSWLDAVLRRLRNASLRAARMNVVIGVRMQEHFTGLGIPSRKLRVIENWADPEAIRPKSSSASALRNGLGLSDRFVVCYSGNLGRAHEFATMLAAAQRLSVERAFVFLIIGAGALTAALKRAVIDRGLENFCFQPYQPRETLEDSLAAADVHLISLLPALEGLVVPSKAYGVLAAGRPLIYIGDPNGDVAQAVQGTGCGRAVSVGDVDALVTALRSFKAQPALCEEMGRRARQLLCERYSMQIARERWVALLRECTNDDESCA